MIDLDDNKLEQIMSGFNIPPKPEVLNQIQAITQSDEPKLAELAEVISKDIGLSSAILKTINSPYFGLHRAVSNIKQAVMFIGLSKVDSIATCLLLKEAFQGKSCISLERFWDNAADVANATLLAGDFVKEKIPLEQLYTAGLFHDCGIVAMSIKYPDYKDTLMQANSAATESITELEQSIYDTDHAVVGFSIADSWNIPTQLCSAILHHHNRDFIVENNDDEQLALIYATLKLAENMVEIVKRNKESADWPFVKEKCFKLVGIDENDYQDLLDTYQNLAQ